MTRLLGSFLVAAVVGSIPAEAAAYCVHGEYRELGPPMVIVLSGLGSAQEEEARWSELMATKRGGTRAYVGGHGEMTLGETTYDFEEVP